MVKNDVNIEMTWKLKYECLYILKNVKKIYS